MGWKTVLLAMLIVSGLAVAAREPEKREQDLEAALQTVLGKLSPEGRLDLSSAQEKWKTALTVICPEASEGCLSLEYAHRRRQIESAVVEEPGFRILRLDEVRAEEVNLAEDEETPHMVIDATRLAYPKIDGASSASEMAFNDAVAREARSLLVGERNSTVDYELLVSGNVLSVEFIFGFDSDGGAHPQYSVTSFNWLIKEGRPLKEADVFAADTEWALFLRQYCFRELSSRDNYNVDQLDQVPNVSAPDRWLFKEEGLAIIFSPYEVAPFAEGAPEVVLPWPVLAAFRKPG